MGHKIIPGQGLFESACEAVLDRIGGIVRRKLTGVLFAGGGGSSWGMKEAIGRDPDFAINHDPQALRMHEVNHPGTVHYATKITAIDPLSVAPRGSMSDLWGSPDCKHFSKAKGGKPVAKNIRDLAWVLVHWAQRVRPDRIYVENVEEFRQWGPLLESGQPDPERKGEYWNAWVKALEREGYVVEWKELKGCDYGVPTSRKRLFIIARCDGQPIVWPQPSHSKTGTDGLPKWRSAAECIDWTLPTRSIFNRERPLAQATLARIAKGIERFVLNNPKPFLVPLTHQGAVRVHDIDEPLRTVTAANRGETAIVVPTFNGVGGRAGQSRPRSADEPMATITAKADTAITVSHLAPYGVPRYGEREGQEPRTHDVTDPMPTVVTTANGFQLCAAFMAQHNTGVVGHTVEEPMSTILERGAQQQLVTSHLMIQRNNSFGRDIEDPSPTATAHTNHLGLVAGHLEVMRNHASGQDLDEPAATVCAEGTHLSVVLSFLTHYYGTGIASDCRAPLATVTTRDRFGLVVTHAAVHIDGETYVLHDIHMRMLSPRELYRAQGFPDSYIIDPEYNGKPLTKTAQVRMCGNSVCPGVAAAIIRANYVHEHEEVAA